jgi:NAD(P)H-dependent FMN reductase
MTASLKKIGILLGSSRKTSNGAGIAAWLESRLRSVSSSTTEIVQLNPDTCSLLPLGPVTHSVIPMTVHESSEYPIPAIQQWSKLICSLSGIIILSPQYNWSFPGELKNALDQLYFEWKDLPTVVVTYGSHGGEKAGVHLKQVLESSLHVKLISQGELEYTLPKEMIQSDKRVTDGEDEKAFLDEYQDKTEEVLKTLLKAAQDKTAGKL